MSAAGPDAPPAVAPLPFPPPYAEATAPAPRFAPGDVVRVRAAAPPGHVRTPWYLRGRVGRVERLCGHFANPEELAYRRDGRPPKPLYRVRFSMREVWGAEAERGDDTLDAEIFEHWLTPAG